MRLLTILFLIRLSTAAKGRNFDQLRSDARNYDEDFDKEVEAPVPDRPVPFGHIFKDGFEDPAGGMKQPIDLLELHSRYIKDSPDMREKIKKYNISYHIVKVPKQGVYRISKAPAVKNKKLSKDETVKVNESVAIWDIAGIQQRNLYDPPRYRIGSEKRRQQAEEGPRYAQERAGEVPNNEYIRKLQGESLNHNLKTNKGSLGIPSKALNKEHNFTSCDEFGRNAKFHPSEIVNRDWLPFYIWTQELTGRSTVARIHTFSYPTKQLVVKYFEELGPHINKTINWEQPKLLLKVDITEMLLVAADRKGLFDGIPYHEIPPNLKGNKNILIPLTAVRLKMVRTYLAMMHCEFKHAIIMAVSGSEPTSPGEAKAAAAKAKLNGPGFPVKRDIEMERLEAKAKRQHEEEMEKDKFITIEDQAAAARSMKLDALHDPSKFIGAY